MSKTFFDKPSLGGDYFKGKIREEVLMIYS